MKDHYDVLDDVFERLLFSKPEMAARASKRHDFSLSCFNNLSVLNLIDGVGGRLFLITKGNGATVDFEPQAMWPFHGQIIAGGEPDGGYQMRRFDTIDTAKARKLGAVRFSKFMVHERIAILRPDGKFYTAASILARINGRWSWALPLLDRSNGQMEIYAGAEQQREDHNGIALAQSVALTERYEWCVAVGFNDGPKVRLHSDPAGLRAMFRDRDKPESGNRRPALKHWVREHWRQSRDDEEAGSWVRRHLRGRVPFKWYGYDCEIRPSAFDEENLLARAS